MQYTAFRSDSISSLCRQLSLRFAVNWHVAGAA
jgi:hypothetical protein